MKRRRMRTRRIRSGGGGKKKTLDIPTEGQTDTRKDGRCDREAGRGRPMIVIVPDCHILDLQRDTRSVSRGLGFTRMCQNPLESIRIDQILD